MIPIIGYINKLSARPGEKLNVMVSSISKQPFNASLIRIRCADPNPSGPGIKEQPIEADFAGQYPSEFQKINIGSFGVVNNTAPLLNQAEYTICARIWPTLTKNKRQVIISWQNSNKQNWALGINSDGCLFLEIGKTEIVNPKILAPRVWYQVWCSINNKTNKLSCSLAEISDNKLGPRNNIEKTVLDLDFEGICPPLIFGAETKNKVCSNFNGKIERPMIFGAEFSEENYPTTERSSVLADWNFSEEISSTKIIDSGPSKMHGKLINLPTRAMTGSSWDGTEMNWRHAPSQYGAIHFHEDDLHNCEWETSFTYDIPMDCPSGIYAIKLECEGNEDKIPFVVCPPKGKKTANLCLIIPTFTYIVYGNHARPSFNDSWKSRAKSWKTYAHNPAENQQFALSTYNFHSDGSGICHSSALRPLLTMRPGYFHFVDQRGSGLRHFQADTHITDWLEEQNIDYDLITDHELHSEGTQVLLPYGVVLTSTHPEYHTKNTLDAIKGYQNMGGRFVYLGGNGFYWKVALHKDEPGVIEIRRGEGGIRAWAAEPGEYYNAFDGEYGGLWRRNGRPPQAIAGLGFSAQGTFVGSYYKRTKESFDPKFKWIFGGIGDSILGDFGLSGGGAAGFELDRADTRLGTPIDAVILASSEGHSRDFIGDKDDFFVLVPEEHLTHLTTWPGDTTDNLIRADMVFYTTQNGGAIFSVGSITFCGSLPTNNYNNNISKLLSNVISRFLDPDPNF